MHILVVEDDRPLARILRKSIESSGHTVDIVADGDEGLASAGTRSHDALVLDLQLPRLSGIEVCRRLRDDGNTVPIIMLTARGAVADRIEGLDVGADDYLPKPFSLAELQARLRALHRRGKVEPELLEPGALELDTSRPRAARERHRGRADRHRARAARVPDAQPRRRALPRPAARAGVGRRLRAGLERRRHLRPLRAPQAEARRRRARPDPHRARPRIRLPRATTEGRPCSPEHASA